MPSPDFTIEQLEAVYDCVGFALSLHALDEDSTKLVEEVEELIEKEMERYNVG